LKGWTSMALKLEKHLVLNRYFLNLFGFNGFNELREKLKDAQEGYDPTDKSYFADVLIGLKPEWESEILRYDSVIKKHVEKLRRNRKQRNFNLKYFQYLAVLFTEIFLDRYYSNKYKFVAELNEFVDKFNNENRTNILPFTEEDLKKLAFWMATGSGKTLIMHINYWQILKYFKSDWDNVILITPNEGLSKQHYEELKLSGIPCKLYDGNIDNLKTKDEEILIIDIHKLTEEKKGEGVSVDISYFDGKNLVFIDEGHKGAGRESETGWKSIREKIAKSGFIFEYSATFGQIIEFRKNGQPKTGKSNQTNLELYNEYVKAIIFDYSYKYFYTDGHGKDFYVYNINKDAYAESQRDLLLTAGLLSFYEQLAIFEEDKKRLREYNIEKPLWVFVGSKVTGEGVNSDVVRIILFLYKIIRDEHYLKEAVKNIIIGKSGLIDNEGNDIFKGKFEFIRELSVDEILEGIYQKVFGGRGKLELYEIKNSGGEIGLKTSTGDKYFGVVNVGGVSDLKKLVEMSEIEVENDHFSESLFYGINENNSPINILIGSKKFVEGWNSWRVSNMGLINMGKNEGPQIIQLFGRGVRLKGRNYSLKREVNSDYKLKALQTLFIFGLNADYVNAFLNTIEKEEVDYKEIIIPIKFNMPEKWEGKIYTIKTPEDFDFLEHPIKLEFDEKILRNIKIDLRPKITIAHGLKVGNVDAVSEEPLEIPDNYLELLDWNSIYSEIANYKIAHQMFNLLIDKEVAKQIVRSKMYKLFIPGSSGLEIENNDSKGMMKITSFDGVKKLHELILMVLKEYMQKFYRREERKETMKHLEAEPLRIKEHQAMFPEYNEIIIKAPQNLTNDINEVITQVEEFASNEEVPEKWENWDSYIVHFDNHLYTPLIIWSKNKEEVKSTPVKLNEGETKFVVDFKKFISRNKDSLGHIDIFLLRNLSRKGVGFFINVGFYPDFIIWVKNETKQNLIFVDPKGIRNLGNFNDDKIQLCVSYIKEIEKNVNEKLKEKERAIALILSAFIISVSSYDDIKTTFGEGNYEREYFEKHNIFFQEDEKYIQKIFAKAGVVEND